jgi:putative transposase
MDSLILPYVNGSCMQIFLDEVSSRHPEDHIVMILDGAGWHRNTELNIPANIRLVNLPPYSPELNPVEHIWDDLREKYFHNHVFDGIDALESHLALALRNMENHPDHVHSIVAWPWIINAL